MNRKHLAAVVFIGIAGGVLPAAEQTTTTATTTTTTTVITETVIRQKTEWSPFRICVLDFTTADTEGQKRFLDQSNKPITIPPQSTLNDADRKSINSIMQGFVRMIDAWDNTRTNTANRTAQTEDNAFTRTKALDLYNTVTHGQSRPTVIGADYLAAYLGRHNDVFSCTGREEMSVAMDKLRQAPDFPQDFMLKLAKATGATHLVYGTVSDLRTRHNAFKGYGIETKTTVYELDVILKMVDLAAQRTVYSNVYTGSYREQRPVSTAQIDDNIFQSLMKAALEQAAEDFYDVCKPGRKNKITVTPLPYTVTVKPAGGWFFKPEQTRILVDGVPAGNGGTPIVIPAGKHTVTVQAEGYKPQSLPLEVKSDLTIEVKLQK